MLAVLKEETDNKSFNYLDMTSALSNLSTIITRSKTQVQHDVTAIKVYCQGSCGISNKMNEAMWALEEQYFNSTLSVADKVRPGLSDALLTGGSEGLQGLLLRA
ncbi:hypothetical protein KUCAC02_009145 [Chaenocephalus aceratus]|uniref:Uncharacterized protein n=1 Tax=Chaenocephalus aceratus TaxID=36190 RepID=A0ACB9WU77_CHAAC|nr:hypothetical protein KUCAC02_009145 [Chaenocephalus aceratus]